MHAVVACTAQWGLVTNITVVFLSFFPFGYCNRWQWQQKWQNKAASCKKRKHRELFFNWIATWERPKQEIRNEFTFTPDLAGDKFPAVQQGNSVVCMFLHRTSLLFVPVNGSAINTEVFPAERQHLNSASSSRGLRNSNWMYEDHKPRRIMLLACTGINTTGADPGLKNMSVCVCVWWVIVPVHVCGFRHVAVCSEGSWPFLRQLL